MTAVKLVNNAQNQSVVSDGHGILVRRYDDEQAGYANEQTKLINAGLYITSDNWRSSETAIVDSILEIRKLKKLRKPTALMLAL